MANGYVKAAGFTTLQNIKLAAEKAAARQAELERKAAEEKVALEAVARKALARLNGAVGGIESKVIEHLADSHQKIIEEVVCQVKNAQTSDQISGFIRGLGGDLTLKLGSVVSDELPHEKLAIKFATTKDEGGVVKFKIVDLNTPDQSVTRHVDLNSLGLQAECKKQKRVETVTGGVPAVNAETMSKILPEATTVLSIVKDSGLVGATAAR